MLNFKVLVMVDVILKVNLYFRFAHFCVTRVPFVQGFCNKRNACQK